MKKERDENEDCPCKFLHQEYDARNERNYEYQKVGKDIFPADP
jgi:hypothetical protein